MRAENGDQIPLSLEKNAIEELDCGQDSPKRVWVILNALLQEPRSPETDHGLGQSIHSLCERWWHGKWSSDSAELEFQTLETFVKCLIRVMELTQESHCTWPASLKDELGRRAPIILTQILGRLLSTQQSNGSWSRSGSNGSHDTAFAVLALAHMVRVPFFAILHSDIRLAVEGGAGFLHPYIQCDMSQNSESNETTGTPQESEVAVLAAIAQGSQMQQSQEFEHILSEASSVKIMGLARFFNNLPNLASQSFMKIKVGALESSLYVGMLRSMRYNIFPVTHSRDKDKYLDYIPIMWSIHSLVRDIFAPPQFVWDMSVLSMFIFLVDEYMEGTVSNFSEAGIHSLRQSIQTMFAVPSQMIRNDSLSNANTQYTSASVNFSLRQQLLTVVIPQNDLGDTAENAEVQRAVEVFGLWAKYHMGYESIQSASCLDLLDLRMETRNYLLYHLHQIEDNQALQKQHLTLHSNQFLAQRMGFAPWLHSVGGGHIGAPIGLVYFACVVGSNIRGVSMDCFSTVKQKLMAWNCNSHAAKQLRMFNDYGSIARDSYEHNLNSTNFVEFFGNGDSSRHAALEDYDPALRSSLRKQTLLEAAQYERARTDEELARLLKELSSEGPHGKTIANLLGLYYAAGDQFSDMYLVKDVTNTTVELVGTR